jgi:hypothetical protein
MPRTREAKRARGSPPERVSTARKKGRPAWPDEVATSPTAQALKLVQSQERAPGQPPTRRKVTTGWTEEVTADLRSDPRAEPDDESLTDSGERRSIILAE